MKEEERYILFRVNQEYGLHLIEDKYEYNRFDAENKSYIAEIKDRHKYYPKTMIEFDKYSYNTQYAKLVDKNFIYIVRVDGQIYIFNITDLNYQNYDYKWSWVTMSKQTEFSDNRKMKKLVGFIDLNRNKGTFK
jgi:hypothetical protein|tara:strand:+ start:196 stop:597 length:402 start_codon:yes stop_codon:yes gene_type:complete